MATNDINMFNAGKRVGDGNGGGNVRGGNDNGGAVNGGGCDGGNLGGSTRSTTFFA
uniref:Uncharacterized protein n=1 Tax=Oryza brachyantha TaxID=4533 RepID=J3MCX2_ORYBR